MTVKTHPAECPYCGTVHDGATSEKSPKRRPSPGDISICVDCGEVGVFTKSATIRKHTASDIAKLEPAQREMVKKESTRLKTLPKGVPRRVIDERKSAQEPFVMRIFGLKLP